MTVFRHIREIDETYASHLTYAARLGAALLVSGACFIVHGLVPAIPPPEAFNLDSTYRRVRDVWVRVNRNRAGGPKEIS